MRSATCTEMQFFFFRNPRNVWFTLTCRIKSGSAWYCTAKFWTVGLQLRRLGRLPRTDRPKYAVVVIRAVTDCSQLFASTFQIYIIPDWTVRFLKSRRQCVISQRRMRSGRWKQRITATASWKTGPPECLPSAGGKSAKTQIIRQL